MSSVTDPYQPVEKELELTRSLLQELAEFHQPRLVIQTRSPIILRDIDLLKRFEHLQVNMTVTTDSEVVRKIFEPLCPSNELRLAAIEALVTAGIDSRITLTPLLPLNDIHGFAKALLSTNVKKFTIQDFHAEKGKFIASTREAALVIIKKFNWSHSRYKQAEDYLLQHLPNLEIGKSGFKPI
jgi:DNA repair photolyase